MSHKLLHPIIIKVYLLRNDLFYLEKELDTFESSEEWPSGSYEDVLLATDRLHRTRDKAVKILGSESTLDNCIYLLDKICGRS